MWYVREELHSTAYQEVAKVHCVVVFVAAMGVVVEVVVVVVVPEPNRPKVF